MGLFSKKDEVPTIPPAPSLPAIPTQESPAAEPEKKDLPELPSFPANSKNENFNQEMVKSAVSDLPSPGEEEVHVEIPKNLNISEEPRVESILPPKLSTESLIPEPPKPISHDLNNPSIMDSPKRSLEMSPSITSKPDSKATEPIFVRIDKFQTAQKNFEEIKGKIEEIESVLKKIKDVKSQEETELNGWTEDIEKIKSRLAEIDVGFFNQV